MENDPWKEKLTEEQYHILREKGTEKPFTGVYNLHFEEGTYKCAGCGAELFSSDAKFDSGCGWPSFDQVVDPNKVILSEDRSLNRIRTEVCCKNCGGHLGHVFPDGPAETTGMRYCINSAAIDFDERK